MQNCSLLSDGHWKRSKKIVLVPVKAEHMQAVSPAT